MPVTLIIPPAFAHLQLQFQHASLNRPAFVTFGSDYAAAGGDFQGAVDDSWSALSTVIARIDSSCTVGPLTARVGDDSGEHLVYTSTATPVAGGRALAGSGPPAMALLVEKLTARGGRRGRGRMFIPWAVVIDTGSEGGAISGTEITGWNTALGTWRTAATSNGVPLVLLHNEGKTAHGAPNVITTLICDPRFGVQRRRMGR